MWPRFREAQDTRKATSALASHYAFTDEELDFIVNYDIKYRMGGTAGGTQRNEMFHLVNIHAYCA